MRRWLVAAVVACSGTWLAAQSVPFRAGARTVAVYATVADADGRLVPDLPRERFGIDDNGKPQEISIFSNDPQPITAVVLLDRSGSMRGQFELVEQAAEAFVQALGPGDKVRIGSFADRIQIDPRDFTADKDEMRHILRSELQEEGATPLWNAVNVGITALLHQQGRRVILVFTDGADRPGRVTASNSTLKDVLKRAEQENVMVYAIGLAGNNGPMGGGRPGRGGPGGPGGPGGRGPGGGGMGGGMGGRGGRGGGMGGPGMGGRGGPGGGGASDKPDEGLKKIAAESGGGYFELTSTDDLASTFTRVADELHHQYLLGFAPTQLDGKTHTLTVRVTGGAVTVRARRSYLARPEAGVSR